MFARSALRGNSEYSTHHHFCFASLRFHIFSHTITGDRIFWGNPKTLTPGPRGPHYGPGPWTTCGPVHGLPLRTPLRTTSKINFKKTEIKTLTACILSTAIGHSCRNFERYAEKM